ncbi:hypothetical protein FRB94_002752 [Tulasnella sp. JGI-2019a]|nr:hypothetical protein FRB94_002752 [Tulasnella sp. JGI-2019a]KAG8992433.1 hypothetical protein FRB93_002362 [Tulasnella sp. JGI-2019a]
MNSITSPPLETERPIFSGGDAEDVTNFILRVQQIGFSQGRSRDDDWHADYAATCLAGAAMRWYCQLDCLPWIHLRRALTLQFPFPLVRDSPETGPPISRSAALPSLVTDEVDTPRQGRIGVISGDGSRFLGYVPKSINGALSYPKALSSIKDKALVVEVPDQGAQISHWKMRTVNQSGSYDYLGLVKDNYFVEQCCFVLCGADGETADKKGAQAAVWNIEMTHFGREELKPAWSDTHRTTSLFLEYHAYSYNITIWFHPNKSNLNTRLIFEPL